MWKIAQSEVLVKENKTKQNALIKPRCTSLLPRL
jgi:hypothetical protein